MYFKTLIYDTALKNIYRDFCVILNSLHVSSNSDVLNKTFFPLILELNQLLIWPKERAVEMRGDVSFTWQRQVVVYRFSVLVSLHIWKTKKEIKKRTQRNQNQTKQEQQKTTLKTHTHKKFETCNNEHHILVFQETFSFEGIYSPHLLFPFLLYPLIKKKNPEVVWFSKEKSLTSKRLKY